MTCENKNGGKMLVSRNNPGKLNIILDLDQTLICSLSTPEELELLPKSFQKKLKKKCKYYDMEGYYRVFERPYLQTFLDFVFTCYNVSIWTAADRDYALFIIDHIIAPSNSDRKLSYIFFGYHCQPSEVFYKSPKNLKILWTVFNLDDFLPSNTVIIDDLPAVQKANPNNIIPAPNFDILVDGEPNEKVLCDTFLLSAIGTIEKIRKKLGRFT
jgi:TFIIF-interacting CTD phosphatase-like protein